MTGISNVFVVTGPLVLLATFDLIRQRFAGQEYRNYVFVYGKNVAAGTSRESCPNNSVIKTFDETSIFGRAKDMRVFRTDLDRILQRPEVNLFVGNCCHMATNYAAFSVDGFREKNIIVEGIGNYYHCGFNLCSNNLRLLAKKMLGLSLRMPYKKYAGHLSGSDTGYFKSIYCYDSEMLVSNPGRVELIQQNKVICEAKKGSVILVLDQPVENFMRPKNAVAARKALFDYVNQFEATTVYYKPHPSSITNEKIPENWKLVQDSSPAELLIQKLGVTHCISFVSSVLLTAQVMFEGVKSTSVGLNLINDESLKQSFYDLLEVKGIEVVRVECCER